MTVINHFAVPQNFPGGTRHVELFEQLDQWDFQIIAARQSDTCRRSQKASSNFLFVPVFGGGTDTARIASWLSFALIAPVLILVKGLKRPDVIYASSPHLLALIVGWITSRVYRVPLIVEVRDVWPRTLVDMGKIRETSLANKVLTHIEMFSYRRAKAVVVFAEGVRAELGKRGIPDQKIVVIPNGPDPDFFLVDESKEELRAELGFSKFTFVYTGAHGIANRLDQLVSAAHEANAENFEVVLVGSGPEKASLQQLTAASPFNRVRFLDPVAKDQVPRILKAADVGVHCLADIELFRFSGSPNKLFDYMAAGLPVITNSPGNITQLVEESQSGLAVAPDGLRGAIETACGASEVKKRAWGANGMAYINEHQSRSAMAARLGVLLDNVTQQER